MFHKAFELCDVVSLVVQRTDDQTCLLVDYTLGRKSADKMFYLPNEKVQHDSWNETAGDLVTQILGQSFKVTLLKLCRYWIPLHAHKYIHHVVYLVKTAKRETIKKVKGINFQWMTIGDVYKANDASSLASPEILNYILMSWNTTFEAECVPVISNAEVDDHAVLELNESRVLHFDAHQLDIFHSAQINKTEQILVYKDFLLATFPYSLMTVHQFTGNLAKLFPDWSLDDCAQLFRTADIEERGSLSFPEYLMIFAVCGFNTPHVGRTAETRCQYIFRYFDSDNTKALSPDQFKNLIKHVYASKKLSADKSEIQKCADAYKTIINFDENGMLSINTFMLAAGDLRLRGTGSILRFNQSLRDYLTNKGIKETIGSNTVLLKGDPKPSHKLFTLCTHSVSVGRNSQELFAEYMGKKMDWVSKSTATALGALPRQSITFNLKSPANELVAALKFFSNPYPQAEKEAFSWGKLNLSSFAFSLISVCNLARDMFRADKRLIDVKTPVYVFGDMHGNYADLVCFEKMFWPLTPTLSASKLLFLGDFVDRGQYSVEVVAYLLAYKVLVPNKILMLRGNHEIRDLQKVFTFHQECVLKFGNTIGTDLWTAINNVFDVLPLAALIDKKIFCCHGGIPPPWMCPELDAINKIPVILPSPDQQSELAWNLMWNDPMKSSALDNNMKRELTARRGFIHNVKRGTGFIFSAEAFNQFLTKHRLSHMIRAHELQPAGISIQFDGKLLTVFSSSLYCGGTNDAACVFVDESRIRIFRIQAKQRMD